MWSPGITATIDNFYNIGKESHFEVNFFFSFSLELATEECLMLWTVRTFICFSIFIHFITKELHHLRNLNFSFKLVIWVFTAIMKIMWAMKSRWHLIQILTFALIFYVILGFFFDFSEPQFTLVYKKGTNNFLYKE